MIYLWEIYDLSLGNLQEIYDFLGFPKTRTGWWLSPTPLKNDGAKVSWYDEILNLQENNPHV